MPGHVIDEHLPGYRLHDRLLRASQVTVAQAPTEESEAPRK
jgi:molecular chaperone GrpE (heat shock protein)